MLDIEEVNLNSSHNPFSGFLYISRKVNIFFYNKYHTSNFELGLNFRIFIFMRKELGSTHSIKLTG